MLSIERTFIKNIVNFNEFVIDHFANTKERTKELKFRSVYTNLNTQHIYFSFYLCTLNQNEMYFEKSDKPRYNKLIMLHMT